jgi:hypothetical protein
LRRTQHGQRAPVRRRCCQASSTPCRHPRAHLLLRSSQHAWRSRPPRNLAAAPGDEYNDDEILTSVPLLSYAQYSRDLAHLRQFDPPSSSHC